MNDQLSVTEVRSILTSLARAEVVDLQKVRELKHRLELLRAGREWEALMAWLDQVLRENAKSMCKFGAALLCDWIAHAAKTCTADGAPTAEAVADWLVQRRYTWTLSRQLRRFYSCGHPVPVVRVGAYVRAGVRVRAHRRLIGNDHLRELTANGWPPIVGQVVHVLAARIPY